MTEFPPCSGCGAVWGGQKAGHCRRCHRTFTTDGNHHKHLVKWRCPQETDEQLTERTGLRPSPSTGRWRMPDPRTVYLEDAVFDPLSGWA